MSNLMNRDNFYFNIERLNYSVIPNSEFEQTTQICAQRLRSYILTILSQPINLTQNAFLNH